jgi:hypothetical protein
MTLLKEFDELLAKEHEKVKREVAGFHSDLVRVAPVDTGEYRDSLQLFTNSMWSWTIKSDMQYASVLWAGRQFHNGRWYGSEQWSEGGDPMLDSFRERLNDIL